MCEQVVNKKIHPCCCKRNSGMSTIPSDYVQQINILIEQKLWLQLSHALKELFASASAQGALPHVYASVIKKYANKLDGAIYLQLCIQLGSLVVLEEAVEVCKGRGEAALGVWAKAAMVPHLLRADKLSEAEAIVAECKAFFEGVEGVKMPVAGQVALYQAAMDVAKVKGDFDEYCKQALFYFNTLLEAADSHKCHHNKTQVSSHCNNKEDISLRLNDYCLASLLSPSIYHFGDLLNVLSKFGSRCMIDAGLALLVQSFNAGEIKKYAKELLPVIKANPGLAPHEPFLKEKLSLMALAELLFLSCQGTRIVQFPVICEYCLVPAGLVEELLIKAMAVGLVEGKIDGLGELYYVERVQPRVLNQAQAVELLQAIKNWRVSVKQTLENVQPFLQTVSQ